MTEQIREQWSVAWFSSTGLHNRRGYKDDLLAVFHALKGKVDWAILYNEYGAEVDRDGAVEDMSADVALDQFFEDIMNELPHGSGIDEDWRVDTHTDTRVVFRNGYHAMDEMGGYDGWIHFGVEYAYNITDVEIVHVCPVCDGFGNGPMMNFGNGPIPTQCTFCLGKGQLRLAPRSAKFIDLTVDEEEFMQWSECSDCDGKINIECPNCEGEGDYWSDTDELFSCDRCEGEGEIKCPHCNEHGTKLYDTLDSHKEYLDSEFGDIKL